MTKMTFMLAALIAAAAFATQAMAARNDVAARHATTKAHTSATGCVRAPNVGAFASDPYTVPPCLPNTATDTFHSDGESGWQASPARLSWDSTPVAAQIPFGRTAAVHVAFVQR